MANTFSQIYIQTVFAVEVRQSLIKPDFKEDLQKYITGIVRNQGQKLIEINCMPDHAHLLAAPLKEREQSLSDFVRAWKSCVTLRLRRTGVVGEIWQREFHDRLLRSDEKIEEKWAYVRQNPVRAGLCETPEEYPFSGTPEEISRRIEHSKVADGRRDT